MNPDCDALICFQVIGDLLGHFFNGFDRLMDKLLIRTADQVMLDDGVQQPDET